jgi:hypothetical protein
MKTAVETVFVGKDRQYNRRFLQMCSHYLVEPVACTPLQAGGPARKRRRKTRHTLGEDAPITKLVSTPPAPQAGTNNDRRSLSGVTLRLIVRRRGEHREWNRVGGGVRHRLQQAPRQVGGRLMTEATRGSSQNLPQIVR